MSSQFPASIHSTNRNPFTGRLRVEDGSTALAENRALRISEPLSLDTVTLPTMQIAFTSPIDFNLVQQSLTCDLGGFLYQVYRSEQGTVTTPFETTIEPIRRNLRTDAPSYTPQIEIKTGGVFVPGVGEKPVDTIRVRAGSNANRAINVSGAENSGRGLPPNTYYIIIGAIAGITGTLTGVLELLYDEG